MRANLLFHIIQCQILEEANCHDPIVSTSNRKWKHPVMRLLYTTSTDLETFLSRKPSYDVRLHGVNVQNSHHNDNLRSQRAVLQPNLCSPVRCNIAFDRVHGVTIQTRVFLLLFAVILFNLA
jgi:hypothetical protein